MEPSGGQRPVRRAPLVSGPRRGAQELFPVEGSSVRLSFPGGGREQSAGASHTPHSCTHTHTHHTHKQTHTHSHTHARTHTHRHKHTREHTPTTQYPDTRTHTQAALTTGAWENRRRLGGAGGGDGKQSCQDKCSSGKRCSGLPARASGRRGQGPRGRSAIQTAVDSRGSRKWPLTWPRSGAPLPRFAFTK